MNPTEIASELRDVKTQIEELLSNAEYLLRQCNDRSVTARAEAYWIPHIKSALGGHGYSAMCSMDDTIQELDQFDEGHDPENEIVFE
jgi:hypothetical protein